MKNISRRVIRLVVCLVLLGMLLAFSLRAQIINDSTTNTLINVTSAIPGTVTIGTNGSFTLLTISTNAFLTNTIHGVIGRNATARSNEVRLISPTSRWQMGGSLFVGSNGPANRLVVSNGAFVENQEGLLGRLSGSSNNFALVTGSGSVWSNRDNLYVGSSGPENRLVVSNGGLVFNATGVMGRESSANNNTALVTGNGSVWTNALDLFVGSLRSGNRLVIETGGQVGCGDDLFLGSGAASQNNELLVTDPGSLLNTRRLTVGSSGNFNRLVVSNGAAVRSLSDTVGGSASFNNQVMVTGAGSTWSNLGLTVGSGSTGHRVDVSDGGRVVTGGSTLGYSISSGNIVFVRDSGSVWNNQGNLIVGDIGSANMFVASNGATVLSSNATIGTSSAPSFGVGGDNLALITGAGTLWSNREVFSVGDFGTSNRMVVSDGALVRSVTGILGGETNANLNSIFLTDPGTRWLLNFSLYVGSNGSLNRLVVTDGALLESDFAAIGSGVSSSNNEVQVTGSGSTWYNTNFLLVGGFGRGNRLVITNGGHVRCGYGQVGYNGGGFNNEAKITGPGSLWTIDGWIAVGNVGSSNRLVITNGGGLWCGGVAYIGTGGTNNEVLVTGPGSFMTNLGPLTVGRAFDRGGNRLIVTNESIVSATDVIIGDLGSTNNRVIVDGGDLLTTIGIFDVQRGTNVLNAGLIDTGTSLLLTNTQGFFEFNGGTLITREATIRNNNAFIIGRAGNTPAVWEIRGPGDHDVRDGIVVGAGASFAQLIHTNGVLLTNDSSAELGTSSTSRSNSATIGGSGSRWWLSDGVVVGGSGSDNRLVVRDGASLVTASHSYLGLDAPSSNNEAVVTGPGTIWNSGTIYGLRVGNDGRNNQLRIENGGQVTSGSSVVGEFPTSSNNLALVTGGGSVWNNSDNLYIGNASTLNQLVVSNGATVLASGNGVIGAASNALRNTTLLTGLGTLWSMGSNLFMGSNGSLNQIIISDGARVENKRGSIGNGLFASNNLALVTGSGSVWSNANELLIGVNGRGNQLVVSNRGVVISSAGAISANGGSRSNLVVITGSGSVWSNANSLTMGPGSGSRLLVSDGAVLRSSSGFIGTGSDASNNAVLVTGPGSEWRTTFNMSIGSSGPRNQLLVSNGATVLIGNGFFLGGTTGSTNNRVVIDGATSRSTNSLGSSVYDIRGGTNVLNAGLIEADHLILTNTLGLFEFNGGTLLTRSATVNNTRPFVVGASGTTPALWSMIGTGAHVFGSSLNIGGSVSQCRLLVTNGAAITSVEGAVGSFSHFNHALISGFASRWDAIGDFAVGAVGSSNSLVISNGGQMTLDFPFIGVQSSSSNNQVLLTGPGSRWTIRELLVGADGPANQLTIANNALVTVSNTVILGFTPATSRNNRLHIPNGQLFVNNAAATGTLDIRHGTNRLDAGLVDADRLRVTNSAGTFELNGGTLSTRAATIANGRPFTVGNGVSEALLLSRGGTNFFANNLVIASNGLLQAHGEITGTLIVSPGGRFLPGAPYDPLHFTGSVILQGRTDLSLRKNGTNLLHNLVTATAGITYGGDLYVTQDGTDALAAGDRFHFFNAAALAGSFSSIFLPPLGPGLNWTNKLLVDGSIEVIGGVSHPGFSSISQSGTNLIFSGTNGTPGANYSILTATNVTLPASNWVSLLTNQFGAGGEFFFTNGIIPEETERYFRLRTP